MRYDCGQDTQHMDQEYTNFDASDIFASFFAGAGPGFPGTFTSGQRFSYN